MLTAEEIFAGESDNIEFKADLPPKSGTYMKTVVAFANGKGGKLVFGVEDNTWKINGFSKSDIFQKIDAITNAISDNCEPKILPDIGIQEIGGQSIIVVEIPSGMQRPYYLKNQGVLNGTYVRVSGTTRPAERYRIQELILSGSNRSFDQIPCEEPITETEINAFCDNLYEQALKLNSSEKSRELIQRVGKSQLLSWKLLFEKNSAYYPTNGYLLLDGKSDKFQDNVIQCAVFKGITRDIFITRKEFSGSIYLQIEDAYQFVLQHINLGAKVEGLARQDSYELPIKAIREMISNAVCHRSYLSPGKIQVALYDDRLEVTSPGMLDSELTIEKMKTGLSKIRNRGIASAFAYMNIIEAWGSGIPKILQEAKEYDLPEPELIDLGSDFRINLFRAATTINYHKNADLRNEDRPDTNDTNPDTNDTNPDTNEIDVEKTIMRLISINPGITQRELKNRLGVSIITIKRLMTELQLTGKIIREGSNRKGIWVIVHQEKNTQQD